MSYPNVNIANTTNFLASGTVSYASAFCKNDNYDVTPQTAWTASRRGVCLLTEISAVVTTPTGKIQAEPYTSSGTSYSEFAIIQAAPTKFVVTRLVSRGDVKPDDHVEPTEEQK